MELDSVGVFCATTVRYLWNQSVAEQDRDYRRYHNITSCPFGK